MRFLSVAFNLTQSIEGKSIVKARYLFFLALIMAASPWFQAAHSKEIIFKTHRWEGQCKIPTTGERKPCIMRKSFSPIQVATIPAEPKAKDMASMERRFAESEAKHTFVVYTAGDIDGFLATQKQINGKLEATMRRFDEQLVKKKKELEATIKTTVQSLPDTLLTEQVVMDLETRLTAHLEKALAVMRAELKAELLEAIR